MLTKLEWRHCYMLPLSSQASFCFDCEYSAQEIWGLGLRNVPEGPKCIASRAQATSTTTTTSMWARFLLISGLLHAGADDAFWLLGPPGKSKGKKIHFCEWNHFNQPIKLALMFHLPWCQLSHPLIIHSAVKDRDVNQIKYLDVGPQAQLPPPTLRTLVLWWPLSFKVR